MPQMTQSEVDAQLLRTKYMNASLFVYSTLQSNQALEALLHRIPNKDVAIVVSKDFYGPYKVKSDPGQGALVSEEIIGLTKNTDCSAENSNNKSSSNSSDNDSDDEPVGDSIILGQILYGLSAREFQLISAVVDDNYYLRPIEVKLLKDDGSEAPECEPSNPCIVGGVNTRELKEMAASHGNNTNGTPNHASLSGKLNYTLKLNKPNLNTEIVGVHPDFQPKTMERAAFGESLGGGSPSRDTSGLNGNLNAEPQTFHGNASFGKSPGQHKRMSKMFGNALSQNNLDEHDEDGIAMKSLLSSKDKICDLIQKPPERSFHGATRIKGHAMILSTACYVYHPDYARYNLLPEKWDFSKSFAKLDGVHNLFVNFCADTWSELRHTWDTKHVFQEDDVRAVYRGIQYKKETNRNYVGAPFIDRTPTVMIYDEF